MSATRTQCRRQYIDVQLRKCFPRGLGEVANIDIDVAYMYMCIIMRVGEGRNPCAFEAHHWQTERKKKYQVYSDVWSD